MAKRTACPNREERVFIIPRPQGPAGVPLDPRTHVEGETSLLTDAHLGSSRSGGQGRIVFPHSQAWERERKSVWPRSIPIGRRQSYAGFAGALFFLVSPLLRALLRT